MSPICNWKPLLWLAPNIFENCLTGTFPYVSTVSLAPFLMWALSHWHLHLNQHCPRGTSPCVTHMHTTTSFLVTFVNEIWTDPTWPVGGKCVLWECLKTNGHQHWLILIVACEILHPILVRLVMFECKHVIVSCTFQNEQLSALYENEHFSATKHQWLWFQSASHTSFNERSAQCLEGQSQSVLTGDSCIRDSFVD